ncbi:hypothetical protein [Lentzea californiensis]|uniref:hypothetical protein n=1 Tax=Lentzea californiensis TaxID=438851 RepID=UPI0021666654|nr:hypothetical protein [Lentzea californiensis]MCR3754572.1 hypothetical protein [Lentzea californiensis]
MRSAAADVETHLRGRSYRDVAAELDVPQATLGSRLHFGLEALRSAGSKWEYDPRREAIRPSTSSELRV